MNINTEFKKGVLFVRLEGVFNKNNSSLFEEEMMSFIRYQGINNIIVNLDKINYIDEETINLFLYLDNVVKSNNGSIHYCSCISSIKDLFIRKTSFHLYDSELKALSVINI